jgi:hypothetical protein
MQMASATMAMLRRDGAVMPDHDERRIRRRKNAALGRRWLVAFWLRDSL